MAIQTIRNGKVTPGIYDTFVEKQIPSTSTIATTALGLVGETLKGPANVITAIDSWSTFESIFGPLDTSKFTENNYPKYELPYIAKEFLTESNNLYVSRVLGLSGYQGSRSWGIIMSGNTYDNEIIGIIKSKGSLENGQTINFDIKDDETLYAKDITLTDSFNIDIVSSETIVGLTVPLNNTTLDGIMSRNNTVITTGTTIPSNGITVDLTNCFLGGALNLSSITGTTIPTKTSETQIISGLYKNDKTLTIQNGVTFYLYDNPLQSSVKVTTVDPVTISDVSVDEYGNIIYTNASTISLINSTVSYFLTETTGTSQLSVSLEKTDSNYILNRLGTSIDDVEGEPIWVDEFYLDSYDCESLISDSSISLKLVELPKAKLDNFKSQYLPGVTPWIVGAFLGGKVKKLFRVITISDGETANEEIKISIVNVDTVNLTFDLLVRDFADTDDNMKILESYRNLNLIKDDDNYISSRIGDSEGNYVLKSSYIIIEMADGSLQNESPSGFEGFPIRNLTKYGYKYPSPKYNISFDEDTKISKQYLGIASTSSMLFDYDFLKYKGINSSTGDDWGSLIDEKTTGFHIQNEASVLTGYTTPTSSIFIDPDTGDLFDDDEIKSRYKFTTMFHSGFDGWNIYSKKRGTTSDYRYNKTQGKAGLTNGSFRYFSDVNFPAGQKAITSDYYAYYKTIRTFANPKTVDINLIATPGIDWVNNSALCNDVLDMVENDRCDALYLMGTADSTDNTVVNAYSAKEIASKLTSMGYDTKFATTFYPWVQYSDTDNNKYIWLPPTKDLARCIAYTDNVGYPWFAPVGYNRGTVNAEQARLKFTAVDTEYLQSANLNYVETFKSEGLKLWGQRLLKKNADSWVTSRIGVQRLNLYFRAQIRNAVKTDLFEQNDDVIVKTIKNQVTPIVSGVASQRGIESDYVITVYQTTEDKDMRQVRVSIAYKPIGALEFIEVTYSVNPNQVTFS